MIDMCKLFHQKKLKKLLERPLHMSFLATKKRHKATLHNPYVLLATPTAKFSVVNPTKKTGK